MALNAEVLELLRVEIGHDPDFSEDSGYTPPDELGSLEDIYDSPTRGNQSILQTALVCWRLRRSQYVSRGFDASDGGSLVNRSQRMKELNRQVARYELLVETTLRAQSDTVLSNYQQNSSDSEYS